MPRPVSWTRWMRAAFRGGQRAGEKPAAQGGLLLRLGGGGVAGQEAGWRFYRT